MKSRLFTEVYNLHPLYGGMSYFPPANECGLRNKKLASSKSIGILMYNQILIHRGSEETILKQIKIRPPPSIFGVSPDLC